MLTTAVAHSADHDAAAFYRQLILAQVPRVLGLIDREALSPTSGCGDRTFWAWKFVDFPRSRFQEALCVMSFLYVTPLDGSACHRNPQLLSWIAAGMRFWSGLQHADGSFDEAYPFEQCLAATAFTTFYVGEAYEFVKADLPEEVRAVVEQTIAKSGTWLIHNDETHGFLSNHLAAAAGALAQAYRVTGDERFAARRDYFIERILSHQSNEGWYDEYGGPDPGYQTHGTFYLARCWQLSGSERLLASLQRSTAFLAHFIHPDGSLGGEYASRNTQTYYPAGFEMLARADSSASWIARTLRPSVATADAAGLPGIDSYNYFPFLNNLVFAYLAVTAGAATVAPVDPSADKDHVWLPDAGLARVRTNRYVAFIGASKGGVIKVFDRERRTLVYSDCGYIGRTAGGALASSQHLDRQRAVSVDAAAIDIHSPFVRFSRPTMNPFLFIGFRTFTTTVGRSPRLAQWLKNRLVKTLVYKQQRLQLSVRRRFEFDAQGITVRDRFSNTAAGELTSLQWASRFATIHMGSSRYFVNHELAAIPAGGPVDVTGDAEIVRRIDVGPVPHAERAQ